MKTTVKNLKNEEVGEIELDEAVFGVPLRTDLLARMVNYQLAKRRSGNHKTKGVSEPPRSRTARRAPAAPVRVRCGLRSSGAAPRSSVRSFAAMRTI